MVLFCLYLILTWNFEFMGSSILMHYEKENALILVLIIIIFSSLLVAFLKIPTINLFKRISNHSFSNIIICLYLLLSIIYSLFNFLIILRNWFYLKTPLIILISLFVFVILIIHKKINFVFYLGFFLGIIFFIPSLLTVFCANNRNLSFLLLVNFNFKNFKIIFTCLFLLLDIIVFLPVNSFLNKKISQKDLVIVIILAGISVLLMMADNYLFLLPDTFEIFNQPALLKYRIYQLDPIGESLDFVILIDLIYLLIIKNSIFFYYLRIFQKAKFKSLITFLILLSIIICPYLLMMMNNYNLIYLIFGGILSLLVFIYYIILQFIFIKERKS